MKRRKLTAKWLVLETTAKLCLARYMPEITEAEAKVLDEVIAMLRAGFPLKIPQA